jgi:hypothetical protein
MIVLAIISHLTAAISVMRFRCIFVIPNYCQFTIQGLGSSALIWINFGLDCEKDRAHDIGLKRCNLPKVAGRSGIRRRALETAVLTHSDRSLRDLTQHKACAAIPTLSTPSVIAANSIPNWRRRYRRIQCEQFCSVTVDREDYIWMDTAWRRRALDPDQFLIQIIFLICLFVKFRSG